MHPEHGVTLLSEVQRCSLGARSSPEWSSTVPCLPCGQTRGPRSPLSPLGVKVTRRVTAPQQQQPGTGQSCTGSCCVPVTFAERDALHGIGLCSSQDRAQYVPLQLR